jgi:hypothetical protein
MSLLKITKERKYSHVDISGYCQQYKTLVTVFIYGKKLFTISLEYKST